MHRPLCIHASQLHDPKSIQSQLFILIWTQSQNSSINELGMKPPILSTLPWSLESKERPETQGNSKEWTCPEAQRRSMPWAIKEELLLNSFLPWRTILSGGAWLTKSSAASDEMPGRRMHLWIPPGWRWNQGCALATTYEEEASLTSFSSVSPFRPTLLHFLKKKVWRQCPESLGWSHFSALREGNIESMLLKCLSAPAWLSTSLYTSHLEVTERSHLHEPPYGCKGIFSFSFICIMPLFLSSLGSSPWPSLGCSKCLGSWAVNYITGLIKFFKITQPKTFNLDGFSPSMWHQFHWGNQELRREYENKLSRVAMRWKPS